MRPKEDDDANNEMWREEQKKISTERETENKRLYTRRVFAFMRHCENTNKQAGYDSRIFENIAKQSLFLCYPACNPHGIKYEN